MKTPKTTVETLLIVDDNRDNLIVMKKVLQKALPQVEIATRQKPEAVMDYVRATNVSVAVFDVQMPVLNGIELCRMIKASEETRHIPVLLVTSHAASSGFKSKGLDAGADDFLIRPIDNHELVARVKVALRISRAEGQLRGTVSQVQQDYRLLFETEPECVKIVSAEGVLLDMNPAGLKLIEAESLAQAQSQPLIEFVVPEHQTAFRELLGQVIQGQSRVLVFECVGLKGGRHWLESHAVPLWDAEHSRTNLLSVTRDITERRKSEAALCRSEDRLRSVFRAAPTGIGVVVDRVLGEVNKRLCEMTGYSTGELNGQNSRMLYPTDEDYESVGREKYEQIRDHGTGTVETRWRCKDGHVIDVLLSSTPLDLTDLSTGVTFTALDITERKQAEEALLESEVRFRGMFEHMSSGVAVYEAVDNGNDFVFVDFNPTAERIENITREDVLGRHVLEAFPQAEAIGIFQVFQRVWRTGEPEHFPVVFYKDERIEGWRENYVYRLPSGEVVAIYDDRTAQKQAELELTKHREHLEELVRERTAQLDVRVTESEELNSAMVNIMEDLRSSNVTLEATGRELIASNQELDAFSYSVSHDLRAPLRHIDGFIELLLKREEGQLDPTSSRYLETIAKSSNRMGRLIDDLLAFSRTGRTETRLRRTDSNKIVQEAVEDLSVPREGRRIKWTVGDLPAVEADHALLRQVWKNLIGNAVKYTGTREAAQIEIGVTREGVEEGAGEIAFFVRDNGVGFDPNYADKLFGVFQRLHRDEEFEGTGIGLAIVRRIVHRHGGRVWAEGQVGHGATFYFTLKEAKGANQRTNGTPETGLTERN